ncbi:stress response translation initiation inhibitor YciH [Candidatus Woesearchaeota archaeon CG10_big_fil_rev_8_21_14_0_10_32_9]|nr:MAG: stress response translation initiation inhibitor YciH [Candidatus Woesearchaeota archaeon CG10_big_fil_rev_8_21_14_0_10_32_9]
MPEIDPITGLPKELGVWENIAKESQKITIKLIKKKFGKKYTVVQGINKHEVDIKELTKKLKNRFACGGTSKAGTVELQGDHTREMRKELVKQGFTPDSIES